MYSPLAMISLLIAGGKKYILIIGNNVAANPNSEIAIKLFANNLAPFIFIVYIAKRIVQLRLSIVTTKFLFVKKNPASAGFRLDCECE